MPRDVFGQEEVVSGGAGVPPRTTLELAPGSLASSTGTNIDADICKHGVVLAIVISHPGIRVRAYGSDALRAADITRSTDADPRDNAGVEFDFLSSSTILEADPVPGLPHLLNLDSEVSSTIYFRVDNQGGSSVSPTINLTYQALEV